MASSFLLLLGILKNATSSYTPLAVWSGTVQKPITSLTWHNMTIAHTLPLSICMFIQYHPCHELSRQITFSVSHLQDNNTGLSIKVVKESHTTCGHPDVVGLQLPLDLASIPKGEGRWKLQHLQQLWESCTFTPPCSGRRENWKGINKTNVPHTGHLCCNGNLDSACNVLF